MRITFSKSGGEMPKRDYILIWNGLLQDVGEAKKLLSDKIKSYFAGNPFQCDCWVSELWQAVKG